MIDRPILNSNLNSAPEEFEVLHYAALTVLRKR